jgi:hypothetical protein
VLEMKADGGIQGDRASLSEYILLASTALFWMFPDRAGWPH